MKISCVFSSTGTWLEKIAAIHAKLHKIASILNQDNDSQLIALSVTQYLLNDIMLIENNIAISVVVAHDASITLRIVIALFPVE
jgi:hypothetical protein